jgi:hypothetical protein
MPIFNFDSPAINCLLAAMSGPPLTADAPAFGPQIYLGFAGKRALGDEVAVRTALTARLKALAEALRGIEPVAIASAAEGGDQLFLEAARDLGWAWRIVLPFAPEIFAQDFSANAPALARFHALCAGAAAIDVIASPPSRRDGFTCCAEAVARQSDALLIVWDGQPGMQGGTSEMLLLARQCDRPTIVLSSDNGTLLKDELASSDALGILRTSVADRHGSGILTSLQHFAEAEPPPQKGRPFPSTSETGGARAIRRLGGHGTPLGKSFRRATLVVLSFHLAATFFGMAGLVFGGDHPPVTLSVFEVALVAIAVGLTLWLEHRDLHGRWVRARFLAEIRRSLLATAACPWRGDFVPRSVWELYEKLRLPLTTFLGRHRPPPAAGVREFAEGYRRLRLRPQIEDNYRPRARAAARQLPAIKAAFWTCSVLTLFGGGLALGFEAMQQEPPAGRAWTLFLRFLPAFLPLVSATLLVLPNLLDLNRRRNSYDAVVRKLKRLDAELAKVLDDLPGPVAPPPTPNGVPVWGDATFAAAFARNRVHTLVQDAELTMLTEVMEFVSFSKNAEVG